MKLERANAFPKLQSYRKILNKEVNNIYDLESKSHGDEHPTVKVAKDILSPPTAPSDGVGESMPPPPKHADDFRPTAPGHSPGVGHSLQN